MIVCFIDVLLMEFFEVMDLFLGDFVFYVVYGLLMMIIVKAFANASWSRERVEIVECLYCCVIIIGIELCDVEEEDDDEC